MQLGDFIARGFYRRGILSREDFVAGGFCRGGIWSQGDFVAGGFCRGGFCCGGGGLSGEDFVVDLFLGPPGFIFFELSVLTINLKSYLTK